MGRARPTVVATRIEGRAVAHYLAPASWASYLLTDEDGFLSDWGIAWADTFAARIPRGYVLSAIVPTDLMADETVTPYCGGPLAVYTFVQGD